MIFECFHLTDENLVYGVHLLPSAFRRGVYGKALCQRSDVFKAFNGDTEAVFVKVTGTLILPELENRICMEINHERIVALIGCFAKGC